MNLTFIVLLFQLVAIITSQIDQHVMYTVLQCGTQSEPFGEVVIVILLLMHCYFTTDCNIYIWWVSRV